MILYIYKQYTTYKSCLLLLQTHEVTSCVNGYAEGFNYKPETCNKSYV